MASRYWVAGVGVWNATAGTKWSTTKGGAGGSANPTSADDVLLTDAPAQFWATVTAYVLTNYRCPTTPNGYCYECTTAGLGGVSEPTWPTTPGATVADGTAVWTCRVASVTIGASDVCLSFDSTGYTGVLAGSSALAVSGSWTFSSGMTVTNTSTITFNSTTTGKTITNNGKSFGGNVTFNGVGGGWTFSDANSVAATVTVTNGALNDGGFSLTASAFSSTNSNVRSLTKTGNWTLTGTGTVWTTSTDTNLTYNVSGNLTLSNSSSSARTITQGTGSKSLGNLFVTAGSGNLTLDSGNNTCGYDSIDTTGFTGQIQDKFIFAKGNVTWGAGSSFVSSTTSFTLNPPSGISIVTCNGVSFDRNVGISAPSATVQLGDDYVSNNQNLGLAQGTFDANNHNVTVTRFVSNNSNVRSLIMGSGTWTLTGTGANVWQLTTTTNLTFSGSNATIKLTDTSTSSKTFNSGGLTYGTVWVAGAGTGNTLIGTGLVDGGNTTIIDTLKIDSAPKTITFGSLDIYNINSLVGFSGTAGNLVSLISNIAGQQYLLKTPNLQEFDYISITDSIGVNGMKWFFGKHSVNNGNNKGVVFDTPQGASQWLLAA